ncbi:Protein 4.1 [Bagarius yarrelli]|uniref:Protein 4.1 n=1 Tax=Bagarius yarrelli TaxID=175774 RepID=A0A556TM38_BAGYA|nr:Protein 4.1 [Bagarius yarrelli]
MVTFRCQVILLDGSIIERDLEKKALGQVLFDNVCEYLNLLERDYFGLAAWDSSNNKVWLNLSKRVYKQLISHNATFTFGVKFYPPDPSLLAEDITRYLLCLQLRTDILTCRLPCSSDTMAVLGSYTIQSEFGDYNPELHGKEFYSNIPFAPDQTPELEEKDASGGDVMLGVCTDGLVVYEEDEENTQTFIWPAVLKMSYKRSNFQARILHSEEESENTIKFSLPSYRACKCLWRNAVEHQAFFGDLENQEKAPKKPLQLGSRFRFNGLTHAESLEASSAIEREAPRFARSAIKRKANESLLVALKRANRTEFVDWFKLLDSDETWPTYSPDKYQLTAEEKETLMYKERKDVDEMNNEWFQLLGGRSFSTQRSFSSSTSDTDILESAKFQLWKLQADDWFVLLEPHTYQPNYWPGKTLPFSPQSSQAGEQREELEWMERKIVQIRKEVRTVTEQYEELEIERNVIRPDIVGENLEMEIEDNERRLEGIKEMIIREGEGEEFQTVVRYKQKTQEVEPYTGQKEAFIEQRIEEMEVEDRVRELMLKTGQVVTKETIEELEETLFEVESIEQKLQDIERLKVKLQEVEMLEQKLQEVQQAGRRQEKSDDWYILLENNLMASSGPVKRLGMKMFRQKLQDKQQKREENGDWYLLLDRKPSMVSSATAGPAMDTKERKAEIRQWIEEELRRTDIAPVKIKDDWYILLDSLTRPIQTRQPALPPLETEVQLSWVNVVEEPQNFGEEIQWSEKRLIHVTETQSTLPKQAEEQKQKQFDDDWFIQLSPSPNQAAVDVYKETREQEEPLVEKQVKTIIYEEERKETVESTGEVVQMNLIPFKKSAVPSGPTMDIIEQKAEISQWMEEERQTANTPAPVQMKDDWYILLDLLSQTRQPALPRSAVDLYEETREEEVQPVRKQVKTITYKEEMREMIETSPEVVQMNPIPFEKIAVPSGPTMDTTEQKAEIRQWLEEERRTANTPAPVQMKDDWYILLDSLPQPTQTRQPAPPPSAVDVYKETREEEVQPVQKQVKTITYKEERREMIETSHKVVQINPIPFQKKAVALGPTMDSTEQEGEITRWIEEERQTANTPAPVQKKDDWYILLDSLPESTQTRQPAPPPSDVYKKTREEKVQLVEKQVKTITYKEERGEMIETSFGEYEGVQMNPVSFKRRDDPSAGLRSQQTVTVTEKVTFDKKPMIIKEKQVLIGAREKIAEDKNNWFVLFTPAQIERKAIATAGVSETWTVKEKRLKEEQKGRLREDAKRSYTVEDKRLHRYVPERKAEARHKEVIDDWFLLLEPVSKKSVREDKRAEEERRRKEELFKKQALAENLEKIPVIPLTPVSQPMTSTPTAQSVRVTRPAYQEESLKRLDITQDITQDIKQESEHHASISKLKRIFMEDIPVFGPTEWDRRLSSYTPVIYPKLSNGELFTGIDIVSLTPYKYWITFLCEINGSITPEQNNCWSLIHH